MPGKQSDEEQVELGAAENKPDEDLGGLTAEELRQGQEAALALEDMMALSAQTLVRAEVDELYQQVRPLGQGRFGQVLLVTHRQKGIGPGDMGGVGGQRHGWWRPAKAGSLRARVPACLRCLGECSWEPPPLCEPQSPPLKTW